MPQFQMNTEPLSKKECYIEPQGSAKVKETSVKTDLGVYFFDTPIVGYRRGRIYSRKVILGKTSRQPTISTKKRGSG